MSTNWGLALDAEISYRHQQIRSDFRPWRRTARRAGDAGAAVTAPPNATAPDSPTTPFRAIELTAQVNGGSTSDRQHADGRQRRAA
ncbi:MAG: hypothetical protein ABWZ02_02305 [Nakamurella sp.]